MTTVTPEEINKFRSELADYPEAIEALDTIEECKGDLENATTLIASRSASPSLREAQDAIGLDDLVDKSKKYLCQPGVKDSWNDMKDVIDILKQFLPPPAPLAVTVAVKLSDIGLKNLCRK